jgi:hypothetical protein
MSLLTFIDVKNLLLDLIVTLQTFQAPRLLPSQNHRANLLEDLSGFVPSVCSSKSDITSVTPLLTKVLNNAPDTEIWDVVYNLVKSSEYRYEVNLHEIIIGILVVSLINILIFAYTGFITVEKRGGLV